MAHTGYLSTVRRVTKLGNLGEALAVECLAQQRFRNIENLNVKWPNYPFADLIAERDDVRYLIGVKARNEMRQGDVGLNESYNLILIPNSKNAELKRQGKSSNEITTILLSEVRALAGKHGAIPAWITIPIRVRQGEYSAYFGLVSDLGNRRSVPMTFEARRRYEVLAENVRDPRITPDLLNR